MNQSPQRVRVTRTRTATTRDRRPSLRTEITSQSPLGAAYLSSLMRAQLRLSLTVVATLTVVLGALPLLFAIVPATRRLEVLGLPLPWVILGLLVYPAAVISARQYTRAAERIEAQFSDVVGDR